METCRAYNRLLLVALITVLGAGISVTGARYEPNWASLDSRPLPGWYDEGKIGIFIHWGVFSVPSFNNEWFWYRWKNMKLPEVVEFMEKNYKPGFTYADFAADFTAELFDPDQWADIFNASGARYVVLTSKHHEGFTNWPSKNAFSWNAKDCGPNKDLVGMLANSIRNRTSIHFGLYHSLFEWFNPLYDRDQANNFTTNDFVKFKTMPELYEIVNTYKPEVVWSDGDAGPVDYWNSTGFLSWLYNDSPVKDTVVTNDRWGDGTNCKHGGYFTCQDKYNPGHVLKPQMGELFYHRQEFLGLQARSPATRLPLYVRAGGHRCRNSELRGNVLINVGPGRDGTIMPLFEERLRGLGKWLDVNGEAIYGTIPWKCQNDTVAKDVWYTSKKTTKGTTDVYAIVLNFPDTGTFRLGCPEPTTSTVVTLLGYGPRITWAGQSGGSGININIPAIPFNKMPCDYAWVFKMEHLK